MAEILLEFGPGAPMAVLTQSLKSMAFKAKLKVDAHKRESGLEDAVQLHFTAQAGATLASRVSKTLLTCFPVFSKRNATISADLDPQRRVAVRLVPPYSRDAYKSTTREFFDRVGRVHAAKDAAARDTELEGAIWRDGTAWLLPERETGSLSWGEDTV
ncbi:MAG: hypothetical protein WBG86_00180 [Polyangiales bacterium]